MVQYIKFFGTEVSDTEDKTTFEELLKNTPEQKAEAHKVERAYHLISQGYWSDADALFDEVLADDPKNSEALMGKQLISRQSRISGRMNSLDARAYKATTREKAAEKNPLRSKAVLWVVIVVFLLVCGFAAASVAGVLPDALDVFGDAKPAVTESMPTPTPTPTPTENVKSADDIYNEYMNGLNKN